MSTNSLSTPKRYHPALIGLHWLVVLVMFSAVLLKPEEEEGRFRGPEGGFQNPGSIQPGNFPAPREVPLDAHMVLGGVLLVLMVARVIVRLTTKRPAWASTGHKLFDVVGELTHLGLYLLTFAILIAGGIMAYNEGLIATVLGTATATAQGFGAGGFLFRALHGLSWNLLFLLLFLHIGAALYHQFITKDNLLARMWFGKTTE